jgi:hypothetical protein
MTEVPISEEPVQSRQHRWDVHRFVRCVIYAHVLGAVLCGLFSHLDSHGGLEGLGLANIVFLPALLSVYACPLLIFGAVCSGRLGRWEVARVCCAEVGIECGQLLALLPAVS